jgi:nucleoid-associated protein YgaU
MNTKVKVGIAAAIVAALVALIVLDQKTAPKDGDAAKGSPPGSTEQVVTNVAAPDAAAQRLREEDFNTLLRQVNDQFGNRKTGSDPKADPAPLKGSEGPVLPKEVKALGADEYVIKEGDSFDRIAKEQYGSTKYVKLLAEANPTVKAGALRVGQKIVLPARRDEAPAPVEAKPAPVTEAPVAVIGTTKYYTVQPGDTLSGISMKVYNTSRYHEKIYEANRERIADAHTLYVGSKLVMPDLPVRQAGAQTGTTPTAAPAALPAGAKVHQVSPGENLWKIAEKYAGDKGIQAMMKIIADANTDRLKDGMATIIREGWQLVIPE